jgi:hypothetical protein
VGGCDFVLYEPYIYESWPSGPGPKEVSYTVHPDGTFSDEVNSANGIPVCGNDHSCLVGGGPNCCTGTYTLTVTSAETGESTTCEGAWGGDTYADCYDGAGWLLKGLNVPEHAFPPDPIYYVDQKDQVIPIEEQGFSARYNYHDVAILPTNVQLANFWDPADGPLPDSLTDWPARPDYTFTCLDDAQEVLARIRLQIREWNEEVQFDTNGTPDTMGEELKFPSPVNDILDWKDITKLGAGHNFVTRIIPLAAIVNNGQENDNGGNP